MATLRQVPKTASTAPALRWVSFGVGLMLVAISGHAYFSGRERTASLQDEQREAEIRTQEARFSREKQSLESKLQELRTQAERSLPVEAERSLPVAGVLSFSTWERRTLPEGEAWTKVGGAEPVTGWERALSELLPTEIEKSFARQPGATTIVLGMDFRHGAAAQDGVGEIDRLALFREGDARAAALVFSPGALIDRSNGAGRTKRLLIDESGLILAASDPAEAGERDPALVGRFRASVPAGQSGGSIESRSWEGFPSTIRFEKLPTWNAYLATEVAHAPIKSGTELSVPELFRYGGLGTLGLLFLFIGTHRRTATVPRVPVASATTPSVTESSRPPSVRSNSDPLSSQPLYSQSLASELEKFLAARSSRSESTALAARGRLLLRAFEAEAKGAGPERIERRLVDAVSAAAGSQVFFFRYDPRQSVAWLSASSVERSNTRASEAKATSGGPGLSFALGEVKARSGRLREHAPLSRLLLGRLGVANFEAWPMIAHSIGHTIGHSTRHSTRHSIAPGPVLGVLVIARPAGGENVASRELVEAFLERAAVYYPR